MASSNTGSGTTIVLSSAEMYWLYLFLLVGDLVLAFAVKVVPAAWGVAGIAPIAIAFLGTLADDYTSTVTPGGTPSWVTYLVMTVVMGIASTIGQFSGDTLLTDVAVVAWLILVLGAIAQDAAEQAGANIPTYVETVVQAFIGGAITFLTWLAATLAQAPQDVTVGAVLATIIGILASYFHVTAQTSSAPTPAPAARPE